MLENIGASELLVIVFVLFLFFGPKKLPSLGKSIGRGLREFKKAMREVQQDLHDPGK